MSFLAITLVFLAAVLGVVLLLAGAALFTPVVVVIDSARTQMRVRWLFAAEYRRPLPGTEGETRLTFAGKPVRLRPRKAKPKVKKAKPGRKAGARARFFSRCLRDSAIRRQLLRQLSRLREGIFRSAEMTRRRVRISLPDHATTGMLAGLQFATNRDWGIEPNFTGENSVFLEIRLHPHRIVRAVLSFLTGLPYWAILRALRASSARASAQ